MSTEKLIDKLLSIKQNRAISYKQMADEAGLNPVTLWRVLNRQRTPSGDVMAALLTTYPNLATVFLPSDIPAGNEQLPQCTEEPTL